MSMENLRDVILSDEYLDFILPYYDGIEQDFSEYGIQFFNSHLVMIHSRRPSENLMNYLETDELPEETVALPQRKRRRQRKPGKYLKA